MPEQSQYPLVTSDGRTGSVLRRGRFLERDARSLVRLDDGREFEVPNDALEVRQDGTFLLHTAPTPPPSEDRKPAASNGTAAANTPVAANNSDSLFSEEADVRRVPVNRVITEIPQTRQEGDVTIVPVVEEVLVVEKRLLLKEEIHIERKRAPVREPRRIFADELRS